MRKPALLAAMTLLAAPALAQSPAPVIDNARVTVRDIVLTPGKPGPVIPHAGDYVVLYFDGGHIHGADGRMTAHPAGDAAFGHGGETHDMAMGAPAREIVVDLKDAPSNTVPNTTGLPNGFPRQGARKVFENDKVIVWNYAWQIGKPTPMHFHNTEVVVAYGGDGAGGQDDTCRPGWRNHHNHERGRLRRGRWNAAPDARGGRDPGLWPGARPALGGGGRTRRAEGHDAVAVIRSPNR